MTNRWIGLLALLLVTIIATGAEGFTVTLSQTATTTNDDPVNPVTVNILVSDTNYVLPIGSVVGQFVADVDFLTGSGTIVLSGYVDTTNTTFGTEILIGSADESTVPFTGPLVPLTLSDPYALTLSATLTLGPLSSVSFSQSVSVSDRASLPVPEPSSAVLLTGALVLAGALLGTRHRRGVASQFF